MPLTVLGLQSRWAGGSAPLRPSQHICPLVPHPAPGFRAGFEGSRVVEVLEGEGRRDGLGGAPLLTPPPVPTVLRAPRSQAGTRQELAVAWEGTAGTNLGGGTHLLEAGDLAGFQSSCIQHQGGPEAEDLP